ncbi:MAG TPA: M3 family metallopeptidase [Xanthobacteraceae bacterium]|nr:M3 family metallopeptidase [Xanthobacteraceae bacterium]
MPEIEAPALLDNNTARLTIAPGDNPLLEDWTASGEVPPFPRIRAEHFLPAYAQALAEHAAEIAAIAAEPAPPTFANTIAALELSGRTLERVDNVFSLLAGADTNDALQEIERVMAPLIARHWNQIHTNAALFRRIDAVTATTEHIGLDAEQKRVLERYHTSFRRAGAALDDAAKRRLAEIMERLAALGTAFSQNVLADEQAFTLRLESEAELAGLPDFIRESLHSGATERDIDGYAVTLSRSTVEPFLQFSDRRDLREKVFRGFVMRGDNGGSTDNKAIIAEMARLRAERAHLLGYADFAHYRLDDAMAKTPAAARDLLGAVWRPARLSALTDRDAMQALIQEDGGNFKLEPWDWRYYTEKLRRRVCDFDETAIKPYLSLDRMIEAAFYTAGRLFGLNFTPRPDAAVWHPDVRVWHVSGPDGKEIGLFFGDYFARASKHSGAWMMSLRDQQKLDGDVTPLIVNVCNFAKAPGGEATLLSFEDARTLFHEFGHALHGLLSSVTYPMIAGTNVATDFVELPSQLFEHWLAQPQLLRRFALHYQTGAPMPEQLLARLVAARNFNKGFATVEYIACAETDLDLHALPPPNPSDPSFDARAFEAASLARIGMPDEIVMRHRLPHFAHIFAGGGYAAAYYSYMWSEVLDADAFAAFEETGDIFDPATAKRLRDCVYAAGDRQDPAEAYKAFRGRLPTADALLRKRGFAAPAAA